MADVTDSKSVGSDTVWVQVPPPAPERHSFLLWKLCLFSYPNLCYSIIKIIYISLRGNIMKKYEYVSLQIAKIFKAGNEEHRNIIDEYASKGYSYIGFMPTNIEGYGRITKVDLIFEKEII